MSGCPPCDEVQKALQTLLDVFKYNSKDGKLDKDGPLMKKMEEKMEEKKKKCPEFQAKMAECKAKMGPGWECDDFKKFCFFVGMELEELNKSNCPGK